MSSLAALVRLPPMRAGAHEGARAWLTALACALGYAALAFWLRQQRLYGDGAAILEGARSGAWSGDMHVAYRLALGALTRALAPHGIHAYELGLALSIGGTSLGLALICRAAIAFGASHASSALLALAIGTSPAVCFFATTVEVHGFFFAWVGASALATVHAARRPRLARLAALGLATGSASFAHATGHLLPALALLLLAAHALERDGRLELRALLRLALPVLLAHLACVLALGLALRHSGLPYDPAAGWAYLELCARQHLEQPILFGRVIWREWLTAHAPWSFAAAGALALRRARPYAIATHLALALYLVLCFLMLATLDERGAYTLPLAPPAIALGLFLAPRRLALAAVLASTLLSVLLIRTHDKPGVLESFELGCERAFGETPALLLVGNGKDLEACLVRMPEREYVALGKLATVPDAQRTALIALAERELDERLRTGQRVVLTRQGEGLLERPAHGRTLGHALLGALRARYRFRFIERGGLSGHELLLR